MVFDRRWSLVALSLFLLPSCTPDSSPSSPLEAVASTAKAAEAGAGPSVSGSAHFDFLGALQTTTFHARVLNSGKVEGTVQLNAHDGSGVKFHGEVECVRVFGNEAVIGGTVTKSNLGGPREAIAFWIHVQDGGEGADAVDQWSDFIYYLEGANVPANLCEVALPFPLFPIEDGNIQVRP
jgi:hypothetical protein